MSEIMCEKCGKKPARVHVVALMGENKVDQWLCEDCAKDFMPFAGGELPLTPELAKSFFEDMLKGTQKLEASKDGFSLRASKIVSDAIAKAVDSGCEHMGTEHLLWSLLSMEKNLAKKIIEGFNLKASDLLQELESWMDKGKKKEGNVFVSYTPMATKVLEKAGEAAKEIGQGFVGSQQILLGLLAAGEGIACKVLNKFGVTYENVAEVIRQIDEQQKAISGKGPRAKANEKTKDVLEVLSGFGRNLNEAARLGKSDPVIGREDEVERLIQILCRRTKNNPVIIGEAGVGKTAIAEALAQKIIKNDGEKDYTKLIQDAINNVGFNGAVIIEEGIYNVKPLFFLFFI